MRTRRRAGFRSWRRWRSDHRGDVNRHWPSGARSARMTWPRLRDLDRHGLKRRHAHHDRLAPIVERQIQRGQQFGVDDLGRVDCRQGGRSECRGSIYRPRAWRPAGWSCPDPDGTAAQSRTVAAGGANPNDSGWPMKVPESGDRRSSLRFLASVSSRVGSAATSVGSTICQWPGPPTLEDQVVHAPLDRQLGRWSLRAC